MVHLPRENFVKRKSRLPKDFPTISPYLPANEKMLRFHVRPRPKRRRYFPEPIAAPFGPFSNCSKGETCLSLIHCVFGWLSWPSLVFRCGGRGRRHRKFYQYPYRAGMLFFRPNQYRPGVFYHPRSLTSFPQVLGSFSMAKTQSLT